MARFFIRRPVFAWVIALMTMLLGALGLGQLPVSQYPEVAPPTVRIGASYAGASAEAVQNSVTTVIEDAMTGLDGMVYMTSSSSRGRASVSIVFDQSEDGEMAQIRVQNRVQGIIPQLPSPVQNSVSVRRATSSILMVGALVSTDGRRSSLELAEMVDKQFRGAIERTPGVGGVQSFGSGYAMRIWLDPARLRQFALTPGDITSAIGTQNTTVNVGALGAQPAVEAQQFTANVTAQSQLRSVDDFRAILLKTTAEGAVVRLGDVARVEIGQASYGGNSRYNGQPAAGFGVNLATGANAVDTAAAVRATMDRIAPALPDGVTVQVPFDTAPFVQQSIQKVHHTLIEAVVLVFLVILIFLQNPRATLIPTLAVPVTLLGTFGVLALFGFSINTMTMFALVLAIGLLVDDAIIVVENVERVMTEQGLPADQATAVSMDELTPALIGTTVVLAAVFLPMAFFAGSTGVIYRQFSVTIIAAMVLSTVFALTLTPALCASLLRPRTRPPIAPARWFNRGFNRLSRGYLAVLGPLIRVPLAALAALAVVIAVAVLFYNRLPGSFLPDEDQGVMMAQIRLPNGATTAQTDALMQQVEDYLLTQETAGVDAIFANQGFSFGGSAQNAAMMFIRLRSYDERLGDPDQTAAQIARRATQAFADNRQGRVFFMAPPAIMGLGDSGGFTAWLLDQGGHGPQALADAAQALVATDDPRVANLRGGEIRQDTALNIDIDAIRASRLGVPLSDVNAMLSTIFSGREVNDFQNGADLNPVIVQGDAAYRMQPDDIFEWFARNTQGEMVPFRAFASIGWQDIPASLNRYGGTAAMQISGQAADGVTSGQAMHAVEELAAALPGGYGVAWTGLAWQQRLASTQEGLLYAISALVVFLALAALYESWSIPLAVMLAVPVGLMGALIAAVLMGQSNDVYFKVGLLTTIGLAAKNAILIVEFASTRHAAGDSVWQAAMTAAGQRLRPIIMTSLAFVMGVFPLARASGAGAGAQNAIGSGVMGGMIAATVIGVLLIPMLYGLVQRLRGQSLR
ncbi:multidrug efflux RND transporter permease subunit [Paracoccus sp. p4-l81]|uniref:multidrug efflux RND transporter permease subunit n=1 Tax=unclassified Paracoccus (in: a-proteobacteria) TaxID=2688777 RepID=UPI0035B7A6A9